MDHATPLHKMFPFSGDFGLDETLKEIEDEIVTRFSLLRTDDENKISTIEEELKVLTLYDEDNTTPINDFKREQRDFLPKQHPMETRSFERVLLSYNLPQFLTPNTTPIDIDLHDRRQRRQVLASVLHEDQIWKQIHLKVPAIKIKDSVRSKTNPVKKSCSNTKNKPVCKSSDVRAKKIVKDCRKQTENSKHKKQSYDSKKKTSKSGLKLKVCTNFLHR